MGWKNNIYLKRLRGSVSFSFASLLMKCYFGCSWRTCTENGKENQTSKSLSENIRTGIRSEQRFLVSISLQKSWNVFLLEKAHLTVNTAYYIFNEKRFLKITISLSLTVIEEKQNEIHLEVNQPWKAALGDFPNVIILGNPIHWKSSEETQSTFPDLTFPIEAFFFVLFFI